MVYLGIFIVQLGLLFWLSRSLTLTLSRLFYRLTRSYSATVNLLAILFLPGTIIHELAHLLVAGVMLVPVGELEVMPQVEENKVQLGSVKIGQTDPFRRLMIGIAPLFSGLTIIISVLFFTKDILLTGNNGWLLVGVIYLIFQITSTMFSSKEDLSGAAALFVAIFIIGFLVWLALFWTNNFDLLLWFTNLDLSGPKGFLILANKILLVPLGINLTLLVLIKSLSGMLRD